MTGAAEAGAEPATTEAPAGPAELGEQVLEVDALGAARATGGEVSKALREVWGMYVPREQF